MSAARFLFANGAAVTVTGKTPPISTFLETHPGAYTTTRTHTHNNDAVSLLFWDRHVTRLSNSLEILLNSDPTLLFGPHHHHHVTLPSAINWDAFVRRRVGDTLSKAVPFAVKRRGSGEELAVSALISGKWNALGGVMGRIDEEVVDRVFDVYVHIGMYVPSVFGVEGNGARLAVVGRGRDVAQAKYSDWARLRKPLEKLRPPSVTELLLTHDGDRILEGSVTNFFVVRRKENNKTEKVNLHDDGCLQSYELQTAPVSDGVLPGITRQLVLEVCLSKGIFVREVSPSWSQRQSWEEAFVTSSLRLVQHVETIKCPTSWSSLESKSWDEISWVEKQFKGTPGVITTVIQGEILKKAGLERHSLALFE